MDNLISRDEVILKIIKELENSNKQIILLTKFQKENNKKINNLEKQIYNLNQQNLILKEQIIILQKNIEFKYKQINSNDNNIQVLVKPNPSL